MTYFVTGATGFIGKFLVKNLLKREGTIYVLVRKNSIKKLEALYPWWGLPAAQKRVVPIAGDLAKVMLGVSAADKGNMPEAAKYLEQAAQSSRRALERTRRAQRTARETD